MPPRLASHSAHVTGLRVMRSMAPLAFMVGIALAPVAAQSGVGELNTAAAVRVLPFDQAEQEMPVRLRGVVTFFDEALYGRFLQDETAGIYLQVTNLPPLEAGQQIEVVGRTGPGEYAPVIVPDEVRILGEAPLPDPRPAEFQELASGQEDSQFVQVSGVVRSVRLDNDSGYYVVELATGGGRLPVYVRTLPTRNPDSLIESRLRVSGVCSTIFNRQRQLFDVRLLVPRPSDLVVETPARRNPFGMQVQSIGSLFQFAPQRDHGRRVKVEGTVSYYQPGEQLFLQDGLQGIRVQTRQMDALSVGDRVEVLGFASQGQYSPVLQDAIYRKIGSREPPAPVPVTLDAALRGIFDGLVIKIPARLLDRAPSGTDRYLILQDEDFVFQAHLTHTNGVDPFAELENGSIVEVTGICRIMPGDWEAGEEWRARAFDILLRSTADVRVLQAPPWWTFGKVLLIAGLLGVATLLAIGWVSVLRRQVIERSRQLEAQVLERQRAERQRAVEQERSRVAQDLHDELGATLTEVNMLSTLATTPALTAARRESYLKQIARVSRSLVSTLDEIVWAVNPQYDSVDSLVSYYSLFAQRFLHLAGMSCRLEVAESFPDVPLDSRLRHGVFLAFKEALNNAIRHSGASEVHIALNVADGWLNIAVSDNGQGFDAAPGTPGSNGLVNMRQRLEKLGGSCEVSSQPDAGTSVRFRMPLEPQP